MYERISGNTVVRKHANRFVRLFFLRFKKKALRAYRAFLKYFYNFVEISFNSTTVNSFINYSVNNKVIISCSLGMIGVKKKKKKQIKHMNYMLGEKFVNMLKELNTHRISKTLIIKQRGVRCFLRSLCSQLRKHLRHIRYVFTGKARIRKKWSQTKYGLMMYFLAMNKKFRMNRRHRRRELHIKKLCLKFYNQLYCVTSRNYIASIPFGTTRSKHKRKVYDRYIFRKRY